MEWVEAWPWATATMTRAKFWLQQLSLLTALSLPLWAHPAWGAALALACYGLAERAERSPRLRKVTWPKLQPDPPPAPPRPRPEGAVVC